MLPDRASLLPGAAGEEQRRQRAERIEYAPHLSPRQEKLLCLYWGIPDGVALSVQELAVMHHTDAERIRWILACAMARQNLRSHRRTLLNERLT